MEAGMRGGWAKTAAGLMIALALTAGGALAETHTENVVAEQRTYVFLQVAPSAAQAFVPQGWTLNPAAMGPTKDANFIMVWIDRKLALTPDGKPLQSGTNRLLVLLAPVRSPSGDAVNMVVGGYSMDPQGAPGAYKLYGAGPVTVDRVEKSNGKLESTVEETWAAKGPDGVSVDLRLSFTRGVPVASTFDLRIFSAAEPSFYRMYRGEQVADFVRSVNTGVNRVPTVALKVTGSGKLATAVNGSERIIAINTMPFYRRNTFLP
jgi:hypothetical protein